MSKIPDFTRYLPPGVYVDSGTIPSVAPPGVDPTVVCLIGEGVGYHTYTETVSFATASSVVLTQRGINPSSVVVTGRITDPAAPGQTLPYTFTADVVGTPADYSTTVNATGGVDNSIVTLVRTTAGKIEQDNPQVTVTYRYTDADYHALNAFDDYDNFTAVYGPALDPTTGAISSPLSLAAQIAMQNGANRLYAVALDATGTQAEQFVRAYKLLAGNFEANVIVPLFRGVTEDSAVAGLIQGVKAQVENDAREGFLRMAFVGTDRAYDPTPTELATLSSQTSSNRVVLAWPNRLQVFNGVLNTNMEVDGFYLAAAYAGMVSAREPQMPLTKKYPVSFSGMATVIKQALTKQVKNQLASAGVCLTEVDRNGRLVVRHGLTTNYAGGVIAREISLIRAQDALYNLVQQALEGSGLVGTPIRSDTALQVKSITAGALEFAQSRGIIVAYNNMKVRQQSPPAGDPTVIEVKFQYKPSYPLNYILVSFSVDTTTGETSLTTDATAITDAANNAALIG